MDPLSFLMAHVIEQITYVFAHRNPGKHSLAPALAQHLFSVIKHIQRNAASSVVRVNKVQINVTTQTTLVVQVLSHNCYMVPNQSTVVPGYNNLQITLLLKINIAVNAWVKKNVFLISRNFQPM
tara:strand:- start:571 stop:942 length:372 start_codon:yes stop_codon:yes gene_type:complete